MYSARLTHQKLEIKRHQGVCKADIKWSLLDNILYKIQSSIRSYLMLSIKLNYH
jgi:hypothetical protein